MTRIEELEHELRAWLTVRNNPDLKVREIGRGMVRRTIRQIRLLDADDVAGDDGGVPAGEPGGVVAGVPDVGAADEDLHPGGGADDGADAGPPPGDGGRAGE